jgi:NAD(P)H-dependent FMN reductase
MKFLILNGSPKGKYSITLQTTRYLEKVYPDHSFEVLNVGQKTKSLEKEFSPARVAIEHADVLLFSYPVYTFIAPYQLHKFIELLKKENMDLSGKFATQITTSKHFYDVTAHRYVQDNCADLGLQYIRGLSADMDDLLTDKGQKEARDFLCKCSIFLRVCRPQLPCLKYLSDC